MKYEKFTYIYPPRPKHVITLKTLGSYDNGQYIAQPKINGSNSLLFISPEKQWQLWNRHGEKQQLYRDLQFEKLYRGSGWMVLNAEYMNKSKQTASGETFNHKFAIFDILVYNGEILDGTTLMQRIDLLNELYPCEDQFIITDKGVEQTEYLCGTGVPDIYRVANFTGNFESLYKKITNPNPALFGTDEQFTKFFMEGLVIKRKNAILEPMFREGNNSSVSVKIRRAQKNFRQ